MPCQPFSPAIHSHPSTTHLYPITPWASARRFPHQKHAAFVSPIPILVPNPPANPVSPTQSLRIVPARENPSSFSHLRAAGAPSAPGLHDTLRHGVGPTAAGSLTSTGDSVAVPDSRHPLEARLKAWEATQESLRMETLRRTFGMAEPIRRGMEAKTVREGSWRPAVLGGGARPSVHGDILSGRDTSVDWEDVFSGDEQRGVVGFHEEMERKLKM
jgi:proteasome maturation protein